MLTNQTIDPHAEKPPFILWRPFISAWHWLVPPTQAHRDRQSHTSRLVGTVAIIAVCLSIAVISVINAKPIYRAYKTWRSTSLVTEARSLADQGEVFTAVMKAQEAYSLSPDHIEAIRLNAEFFTMMKKDEAIYFWDKLGGLGATTAADQQMHVRALLNANRGKEAQQLLEDVLSHSSASDSTLKLAQDVFGKEVFVSNMVPKLKEYAAQNPDDKQNQFRLAQLQVESSLPAEVNQGLATLWELAALDDANGLRALEYLNQFPELPPEDMNRLIKRLQNHPRSTPVHGVEALRRQLQLQPDRRTTILTEGVNRYRDAKREDLLPLVRWLIDEREPHQVLALLREEDVLDFQPLLENYLTCLTLLGRFEDLERLVNEPRVEKNLTRALTAFYKMHLAFVTRKPLEEVRANMKTAIIHSEQEGRSELLVAIGRYGEGRAMHDLAEQAYELAYQSRRTRIQGLEGLLRATRANGNSNGFLSAILKAARQWPDNQTYQEQLIYINLLTGRSMELSLFEAERLIKIRPSDHLLKLLVAMGWWRLQDVDKAVQSMQNMDLRELTPGQQAVFAAVARRAGFADEALSVTRAIPADAAMFPEERVLFQGASR